MQIVYGMVNPWIIGFGRYGKGMTKADGVPSMPCAILLVLRKPLAYLLGRFTIVTGGFSLATNALYDMAFDEEILPLLIQAVTPLANALTDESVHFALTPPIPWSFWAQRQSPLSRSYVMRPSLAATNSQGCIRCHLENNRNVRRKMGWRFLV